MTGFCLTAVVVTLATWCAVDIYEFSIYFAPLRATADRWKRCPARFRSFLGKGLSCRYCLGHWLAAGVTLLVMRFPTTFANNLTVLDALLLIPIAARLAALISENVLQPLTGSEYEDGFPDTSTHGEPDP